MANSGRDIRVSFCPKCKSRSVRYVFGLGNLFGVIPKMQCMNCGFSSQVFPVLIANEEELKKAIGEMKSKKKVKKKIIRKRPVRKKVAKKVVKKKPVKKVARRRR